MSNGLDALLDCTEPVEVEFRDHKVTIHVYTAGVDRLTKEERKLVEQVEGEEQDTIDTIRKTLPILVSSIELDGEPLERKGKGFPENVPLLPDKLLVAIGNAAIDKWNAANPTSGEQSPSGGQPEEKPAQSQVAAM